MTNQNYLFISENPPNVQYLIYTDVPPDLAISFIGAISHGKYYLAYIKGRFKTRRFNNNNKNEKMADKIINVKIDLTKIDKEFLFKGEKGVYLDCTIFYNQEEDAYGQCGMVVQSVPKAIREQDRTIRGAIIGNIKEFRQRVNTEAHAGSETGRPIGQDTGVLDDLPF